MLQRRVAGELRIKRTPTLEFEYDPTTDRAMRLEQILGDAEDSVFGREEVAERPPRSAKKADL